MYRYIEKTKKMLLIVMTVSLSFLFMITPVHAAGADDNTISTDPDGRINLRINNDEWYAEGSTFRLYQVETISSDLEFTRTDAFKKAEVSLKPENLTGETKATADKWMRASTDLIAYVRKNNIAENDETEMYNRSCEFDHLVPGLYLIQGDTGKEGNRTVTYQPVLICVPQRMSATEPWNYSITSEVKTANPTYTHPAETPTPSPSVTPQPSSPSEKPDTRDSFNGRLYAGVLVAMGVVIGIVIYIRNKERKD